MDTNETRLDTAWVADALSAAERMETEARNLCQMLGIREAATLARKAAAAVRHYVAVLEHQQRCRDCGLPINSTTAECRAAEQAQADAIRARIIAVEQGFALARRGGA